MAHKPLDDEEFGTTLANIFLIAAVALVGVLALYFSQFHGPLSPVHVRWNEFGGFLGGTVGPLFSFLSCLCCCRHWQCSGER